ncbi:MAG TPA: alpha/beta hydrolase-fold protein [Blastocatellia bacterium]|nr:alpha/beta hydrolase-fold protein [Blastocatellia bacterium]
MRKAFPLLAAIAVVVVAGPFDLDRVVRASPNNAPSAGRQRSTTLKFEVSFPSTVRNEPTDGRVFIIISKRESPEPRLQIHDYSDVTPFFGVNVDGLRPGQRTVVDDSAYGYPLERLHEIPAGDYYVQALLNVYTTFHRADGHVVKMHMDHWEGQQFQISPGNLYSNPSRIHVEPGAGGTFKLSLDNVIPPIADSPDTEYVKHIKIQSQLLTKFWGQPIYLGATILLPKDYNSNPAVYYPVNYEQGHFSTAPPGRFQVSDSLPENASDQMKARVETMQEFSRQWVSDKFPRMLYVTFQHPTPYYDDSYAVDSPNVGPYGTAITQELMPYIESHFRAIPKPWARILSGGSTGGWESLALQIFYPDYFGGTFSYCPDPVDFHFFQIVNIYDWPNAFYRETGWVKVPLPGERDINGVVLSTMKQQFDYETARGDRGRSGEQWAAWEAVYGPLGDDGYFKPLIDPGTGEIDRQVADYWRAHMDLTNYLRTHWTEMGPKLTGKIHIWVGDMDTYYLNDGVHVLDDFLSKTSNPPCGCGITYGPRKPHCWVGPENLSERIKAMAQYIAEHAPKDADLSWWRF